MSLSPSSIVDNFSTAGNSNSVSNLSGSSISDQMTIFPGSSFFKKNRASTLPTPAEVRARNEKTGNPRAKYFDRPSPVIFSSLGLLVKYGGNVTVIEAQTQMMVRESLQDKVPIPEVFGWTKDGDQTFIYMSFIEGVTLQDRWPTMEKDEKDAVCKQLNQIMKALRTLKQDDHDPYIGSLGKQPLNEIIIRSRPELAGPYYGANAVQQFQDACGINIDVKARIVFTHNDLAPPNIILASGPNPKVAAIIDFGQAGWLPAYWEYCKAKWVRIDPRHFSDDAQEELHTEYLPKILNRVDDKTHYHPWFYFALSNGC
ncbi:phosphotransferase enzyme family protein [Sclerotinia borealis F-4128]|uniref:Phosphotransferase enzyme family protein n=1 Tax=Sclerotinia borealis (strain F-4128) TaxID=1432307 RepID=W9CL58_SCLBF|nr:phosphotransferase enzyme family protein [Sclerotinia borealis F-4128]